MTQPMQHRSIHHGFSLRWRSNLIDVWTVLASRQHLEAIIADDAPINQNYFTVKTIPNRLLDPLSSDGRFAQAQMIEMNVKTRETIVDKNACDI